MYKRVFCQKIEGCIIEQVVVPLCGGNIDITMLGRVIERGTLTR